MAWSERLASGRYRGVYRDRAGRRHRLADTYTQPAEAKREAGRREDELRQRPAAKKRVSRICWGDWCDEWLAEHRQVEPGTQGSDDSRIARHIRPYWRDVPIGDIDRQAVVDWIDVVRATPRHGDSGELLSHRSVLKVVNIFSASMRDAVVAGRIPVSPCQHLAMTRPQADDEYYLSPAEVDRLLAAADEVTRMVVEFAVGTGLRWGELAGLHRRRVVTAERRILVQEVVDRQAQEIKPYPKGRRRRGVPITAELAGRLETWMAEHPAPRCASRHRDGADCGDALLFPSQSGTMLHYQNFRRRHFDPALAAAGLVGVTPHDLRHTYASWLIQSKRVTLDELGVLLGHQDRSTTQRYAHFGEDHWDDVRDVLGAEHQTPDEAAARATIARLAAERPEWAAAAAAIEGTTEPVTSGNGKKVAPHLPLEEDQQEGGKIIRLDRFRSSGA